MNGGVRRKGGASMAASCLAGCLSARLVACLVAVGVAVLVTAPAFAQGRAVLRRADVDVTMTAPTACDVRARLTIDAPESVVVDHRLQTFDEARAEVVEITGAARQTGDVRPIGRTLALTLALNGSGLRTYTIRYRVTQAAGWMYRCPIWVPTTPTDGQSREVHLQVQVPRGTAPTRGAFPAFTWTAADPAAASVGAGSAGARPVAAAAGGTASLGTTSIGRATIGHLPVFVRVPFEAPGQEPGWLARQDFASVTDITAVVVLVLGTIVWVWRAKR